MTDLLSSPFAPAFAQFAGEIRDECIICSPYITRPPIRDLVNVLDAKNPQNDIKIHVITDLSCRTLVQGGTDASALLYLFARRDNVRLTNLAGIHAKVYIANSSSAIVTSANFTQGGAGRNFEYGVRIKTRAAVRKIRADIEAYRRLGVGVTHTALRKIDVQAKKVKTLLQAEQQKIARVVKLKSEAQQRVLQKHLIEMHFEKKSINSIFSETLVYLLSKQPATTKELNLLVSAIHPDLCDDDVVYVNDEGVSYGRKWKHRVRLAQAHLQRTGRIARDAHTKKWRKIS